MAASVARQLSRIQHVPVPVNVHFPVPLPTAEIIPLGPGHHNMGGCCFVYIPKRRRRVAQIFFVTIVKLVFPYSHPTHHRSNP